MMIRTMQPAGSALEKLVMKSLRQAAAGEAPVLAWPLACGKKVASRTKPMDFSDGVLRIEVPDWGWQAELQSMASQYLAILNRYSNESVKRIEFVVPNIARMRPAK